MSVRLVQSCSSRRRSFFTLPDLLPGLNKAPDVQKYREQKILPYIPRQLYAIVADVANYPRFVPFCIGSRILGVSKRFQQGFELTCMEAELTVGFLAFKESYVSHVTCRPFESVEAVASSSTPLFNTLETKWQFHPISLSTDSSQSREDQSKPTHQSFGSTLTTLDLTFAFANPLYAKVSATFFSQISTMMIKAFEDECLRAYGSSRIA